MLNLLLAAQHEPLFPEPSAGERALNLILVLIPALLILGLLVLTVLMLVRSAQRGQWAWFVVILFMNLFAAVPYYFLEDRAQD